MSGASPLLKVAMAMTKDIVTIMKTTIRFVVSKITKLRKLPFKGIVCASNYNAAQP